MEIQSLKAEARDDRGSAAARRLRRAGKVPGVLYGHGEQVVAFSISAVEMNQLLHSGHHVVTLDLAGQEERALLREVQLDTWEKEILHVDFTRVGLHETVTVSVEVVSHGTPKAALSGGILEQPLHRVELECRADAIPEQIRVEVGELEIGDMIHVRDLPLPPEVKAATDADSLVLVMHEARGAVVEEAEAALKEEEAAEPEVIGHAARTEEEAAEEEKS